MVTAVLVALSFNYPQAIHNIKFVAHQASHAVVHVLKHGVHHKK